MPEKPLPSDVNGRRIQGGSVISAIDNISITTGSYVAITVPADIFAKAVIIKTRAGEDWRLATSASPTEYMLLSNSLSINLSVEGDDIIGYARSDSASDTLELLYID